VSERIARAHRAQSALDEFLSPLFDGMRDEYLKRIAEVATTELAPHTRSDKIATLSVALKVVDTLKSGMAEVVRDGELAQRDKLKADNISRLSDAQQRLLRIAG
jgi:phosphopantothenate synthetase